MKKSMCIVAVFLIPAGTVFAQSFESSILTNTLVASKNGGNSTSTAII